MGRPGPTPLSLFRGIALDVISRKPTESSLKPFGDCLENYRCFLIRVTQERLLHVVHGSYTWMASWTVPRTDSLIVLRRILPEFPPGKHLASLVWNFAQGLLGTHFWKVYLKASLDDSCKPPRKLSLDDSLKEFPVCNLDTYVICKAPLSPS